LQLSSNYAVVLKAATQLAASKNENHVSGHVACYQDWPNTDLLLRYFDKLDTSCQIRSSYCFQRHIKIIALLREYSRGINDTGYPGASRFYEPPVPSDNSLSRDNLILFTE